MFSKKILQSESYKYKIRLVYIVILSFVLQYGIVNHIIHLSVSTITDVCLSATSLEIKRNHSSQQ